ncbi:trp operon repressor [Neisseriaceae bacterium ESL0693]|nr:trp operon repressor [Neisseriaceae bacterium ESL0693]
MDKQTALDLLINRLSDIHSQNEMHWFLQCILTEAELDNIADRIRIYAALNQQQHSQREIAKQLGVSITKITRGAANFYQLQNNPYFQSLFAAKPKDD